MYVGDDDGSGGSFVRRFSPSGTLLSSLPVGGAHGGLASDANGNVFVVRLHSTIGPLHLTYYEHTRGKYVSYHPRGIVLPNTCPHGGFHFAASFAFEDGAHTRAHTAVPCPR